MRELMFQRGLDVSHETIRAWCGRSELTAGLRRQEVRQGQTWHLDELRIVVGSHVHWLWRAISQHGVGLDVLVHAHRDTASARRFFQRLLDEHPRPEQIVTDKLAE